jgi:putative ABC transport system ATP-binding protein
MSALSAAARDRYRGTHIGYIFQLFNLVPYLTARENIELPVKLHATRRARVKAGVDELARHLGIVDILHRKPVELSVGQQQRVAAARALIGAPELVIADEPTSSLDADAREQFLQLLFEEVKAAGATLIFVSHDRSLAPLFTQAVSLRELNQAA